MMIRILIVDDHVLMREGLKQLFHGEDDIQVLAEAGNGEEALHLLAQETFDLILLDVSMPGIQSVELIARIRKLPSFPPILVLSMHNEPQIAKRKLKAGAAGYITKDSSPQDLLQAIHKVAAGERYISSYLAEKIVCELSSAAPIVPHDLLSGRELLVLRLWAQGKKINEIALMLKISNKTVSTHKARLMQKMHIDTDINLFKYAIAHDMTRQM